MRTSRRGPAVVIATVLAAMILCSAPAFAQRGRPTYPQVQAASIVPEYAAVLDALDPAKPESILKARDAALAKYAKAASADADAVFRQFKAFYESVLVKTPYVRLHSPLDELLNDICKKGVLQCRAATADAFLASAEPGAVKRRDAKKPAVADLARYRSCGIWFSFGEGNWYAAPDPAFVAGIADRLPLGELRAWVTFWAAEAPERVAEDASIVIGWEGVRRRLARWESFARAHPTLPETQVDVRPQVVWLVALYVFGIDNTLAYDERPGATPSYDVRVGAAPPPGAPGWTRRIDPQLRSSYDRFLVENRDSAYYNVIDGIVSRLRSSNGAPTKDLIDFLRAELTDPYFKDWFNHTDRWLSGR